MYARMECWIVTSKNLVKLKQYYYFHAEFLEEVRYSCLILSMIKTYRELSQYTAGWIKRTNQDTASLIDSSICTIFASCFAAYMPLQLPVMVYLSLEIDFCSYFLPNTSSFKRYSDGLMYHGNPEIFILYLSAGTLYLCFPTKSV